MALSKGEQIPLVTVTVVATALTRTTQDPPSKVGRLATGRLSLKLLAKDKASFGHGWMAFSISQWL